MNKSEKQALIHTIDPIYGPDSEILILGSFPSVKSREEGFFYGHCQNRFWKVLSALLKVPVPECTEEKKALLHASHIAVFDVVYSCRIQGSSDSTVSDVVPTDLGPILTTADIKAVFTNGKTAHRLYGVYQKNSTGLADIPLPSTSPANAAWTLEELTDAWSAILPYLRTNG